MQLCQEAKWCSSSCWSGDGSGADTGAEQAGCAQPCRADLVQGWLGSKGVFNGWGQKTHNYIAGAMIVLVWA